MKGEGSWQSSRHVCVIISLLFSFLFSSLCVFFFCRTGKTRARTCIPPSSSGLDQTTTMAMSPSFAASFRKRTSLRRERDTRTPHWRWIGCYLSQDLRAARTHSELLIKAAAMRFRRDFLLLSVRYILFFYFLFFLVSLFLSSLFGSWTVCVSRLFLFGQTVPSCFVILPHFSLLKWHSDGCDGV